MSVDADLKSMMYNSPDIWSIDDGHGHIVYMNPANLSLLSLSKKFNVEGRRYEEIPNPIFERFADEFCIYNRTTYLEEKPHEVIEIHYYDDLGWKAYYQHIDILRDKKTGTKCGLIIKGKPLDNHWISRINEIREHSKIGSLNKTGGASLELKTPMGLSHQQAHIMLLLMYGMKPKDVEQCLHLNMGTLQGYIARMKVKFGVNTRQQLVEKAFEEGNFQNYCLPSFLRRDVSLPLSYINTPEG